MSFDKSSSSAPADAAQGLSLACLGHDLRAALGEMLGSLHLINKLDMPDHLRDPINRARAVGADLSRLIDQSVLVCLGQGSALVAPSVVVETADLFSVLRQRWEGPSREAGFSFHLIEAGDVPRRLRIDRTALERVLANLISNALHHGIPGPVTVTLKFSGGDLLLISVEDAGPGFPVEHLAAIQRDFALPPEARRPGGGFGLQSVKLLVQAMGGRCNARNKAQGGAEVGICLPLADLADDSDATGESRVPVLAPPPDLTGTHVLLADDSASSRELVSVLARHIGASIQTVPDGRAAIDALRSGPPPDVLIVDDEMPGVTGIKVLEWLRAQAGPLAALPVLALTSHIGAQQVAALHHAGATTVLAKPVLCPLELGRAILQAQGRDALGQASPPPMAEARTLAHLAQLAGPDAAAELFEKMEQDLSTARAGLARASAGRALDDIRTHSHVIIALAGTVGAAALHADAVTLNSMAHGQEPAERIIALAERLDQSLASLLDAVRQAAAHQREASAS